MVKRALCVGCNYPSKAFGLAGAVNDAFLIADCLQKNCGFDAENVCVLHDVHPGQKKSMKVDASKKPSRVNILQSLQMLVRHARSGDALFFSFSGYGLQVDDMDGYQNEGYDEAILPTDFVDGRDGDYAVIVADDIHDILMGVPPNCAVTVLMDCDHATSVVDVAGTIDGGLVNGLLYQTYCGLSAHTTKVQLAAHNRDVWQEERARAVKARPRFQPMMEIDNPRKGRLPTRPGMSRSNPIAFALSAAGHGQTTMELQFSTVVDGKDTPRQHGVLTWCFVQALKHLEYECNYIQLLECMRIEMETIKQRDLPGMDQEVLLTFSLPFSDPQTMKVLQPPPIIERQTPFGSGISDHGLPSGVRPLLPQMHAGSDPMRDPRHRDGGMGAFHGSPQKSVGSSASAEDNKLPSPPSWQHRDALRDCREQSGEPPVHDFRGADSMGSSQAGVGANYGPPPPQVELWPEAVSSGHGGGGGHRDADLAAHTAPHSGGTEQHEDRGGHPPPAPEGGYLSGAPQAAPDLSNSAGFFGLGSVPTPGSFIGLRPPTLQQPPLHGVPMQAAPMQGSFQFGGTRHYPGAVYGAPRGSMPPGVIAPPPGGGAGAYGSSPYPGQMGRAH